MHYEARDKTKKYVEIVVGSETKTENNWTLNAVDVVKTKYE